MSDATPFYSVPTGGLDAAAALPAGTRVAEFEIKSVLGAGGFGIVYLAWDTALEREVALKEYMPGTLAGRGEGLAVTLRSQASADTFALGLRSFVNEARMLARFDHPALVKVHRFWEDNGTAYMVMPRYHGRTLRQVRAGMVVPPGEAACRQVLDALLSALDVLHKEGVYHRDIAPDNILIGDDGLPVLLDFGAARRVIGDGSKALTSIMKPHFAPLEQYADQSAMRQGPWTDLYALGGTIYFLITGREPVPAASRALHDDQPRLAELCPPDFSPGFLAAVDWMLAIKPPERPQSVYMLRDVLEGRITLPGRKSADRTVPGIASREVDILTSPGELHSTGVDVAAAEPPARTVVMAPVVPPKPSPQPVPAAAAPPATQPATLLPRHLLAPVLGLLVALNVLAWWWFTQSSGPSPAKTDAPAVAAQPNGGAVPANAVQERLANERDPVETVLSVLPARSLKAGVGASGVSPAAPATPGARAPEAPVMLPRQAAVEPVARSRSAAVDDGPRARCGDRNFLLQLVCMKRECSEPALQNHPECVKMQEQEQALRRSHER